MRSTQSFFYFTFFLNKVLTFSTLTSNNALNETNLRNHDTDITIYLTNPKITAHFQDSAFAFRTLYRPISTCARAHSSLFHRIRTNYQLINVRFSYVSVLRNQFHRPLDGAHLKLGYNLVDKDLTKVNIT